MPIPNLPQTDALVPLAPVSPMPFPDEVPEEFFIGLSFREQRFLMHYLEWGNATRAYVYANEPNDYANPQSPISGGSLWLRKPKIQNALNRIQAFYAYHTGLHAWQILGKLHSQAMMDPIDIYENNGESWNVKPMAEWPAHIRQCVQRVTIKEWETRSGAPGRQIDVEFTDRQQSQFLLGKHMKLFEKSNRQLAPFTLVLNTNAPEVDAKRVGEVIQGIGLEIQMPEEVPSLPPPPPGVR